MDFAKKSVRFNNLVLKWLLTLLGQTCITQGTYKISCQDLRFFPPKLKQEGLEPLLNLPSASWPQHQVVFFQGFYVSACPEAGFTAPRRSWCLPSSVLNMLNRTHYPAFIFYNHGLLSKVIRASPWHARTLSAASSAWYSCVHTVPQPALAVLSYPPSSAHNGLTFCTAPTWMHIHSLCQC